MKRILRELWAAVSWVFGLTSIVVCLVVGAVAAVLWYVGLGLTALVRTCLEKLAAARGRARGRLL